MKRVGIILTAIVAAVFMLSACTVNTGLIAPVDEKEARTAEATLENSGLRIGAADAAEAAVFTYKWQEPVKNVRVWADLYRDGQYTSEPVEINVPDAGTLSGKIALYTEELNGEEQNFSLLLSCETDAGTHTYAKTGKIETGQAMSPGSSVQLEDTQIVELGEQNVLLVMHDGPNLDTEMQNQLHETEQLIAGSTYTLVLNCEFA